MGPFVVPGLPEEGPFGNLHHVPSWLDDEYWLALGQPAWNEATVDQGGRLAWRDWRRRLILYRDSVHGAADKGGKARQLELDRCEASDKYFLAVYGWMFEPRDYADPDYPDKGWRQWALIPPQVWLLDEINEALRHPSPLGDLLVEKSRDMGATWTFCGWVAHRWLFDRNFTAGLMSYREVEVVEDHPDSMLFKVKAVLGLESQVPGLPPWMFPELSRGGDFFVRKKELDHRATLAHPTRTNFLRGETTTEYSGVGNRTYARLHDEAARWKGASLRNVMTNTANTTNHRFLLSTANVEYGDFFKKMADKLRNAADADRTMGFVRLETKLHPFHDDAYLANEREKAVINDDLAGFEREVMINYRGGQARVYADYLPDARIAFDPDLVWDPMLKTIVSVDPGLSNACGVVVAQVIPKPDAADPLWPRGRAYDVVWLDAYMLSGHGTDFWAHVLTGIMPEEEDAAYGLFYDGGHDRRDARTRELMLLMARLPWSGPRIQWTGDPAGENREQSSKTSWYKALANATKPIRVRFDEQDEDGEDRGRITGIYPAIAGMHKYRSFQERQIHLRPVLRRSRFAATPGARELYDAIDGAHQLDPTPRMQREPGMAHDEASNLWTAAEYLAVFLRMAPGIGKIRDERKADEDLKRVMGLPPGPQDPRRRRVA